MTKGASCNHCKKNHWGQADQCEGSRISMSAQDFMPRHFEQVCIAEVEAWTCMDAPSDEEAGAVSLQSSMGHMCQSQQGIVDLHADR